MIWERKCKGTLTRHRTTQKLKSDTGYLSIHHSVVIVGQLKSCGNDWSFQMVSYRSYTVEVSGKHLQIDKESSCYLSNVKHFRRYQCVGMNVSSTVLTFFEDKKSWNSAKSKKKMCPSYQHFWHIISKGTTYISISIVVVYLFYINLHRQKTYPDCAINF